eukprot:Nk52_evm13s224 gene=Nk52_evmTU13s224
MKGGDALVAADLVLLEDPFVDDARSSSSGSPKKQRIESRLSALAASKWNSIPSTEPQSDRISSSHGLPAHNGESTTSQSSADAAENVLTELCEWLKGRNIRFINGYEGEDEEQKLIDMGCIFVLKDFKGERAEQILIRLKGKRPKCFIAGAPLILSLCKSSRSPFRYCEESNSQAVFSNIFSKYLICCSGYSQTERERIYQLAEFLGGRTSGDFTHSVTHLVAENDTTQKYQVALKMKKVIINSRLMELAFEKKRFSTGTKIDFGHLEASRKESSTLLKGVKVCVTGIDAEPRSKIWRDVEDYGGEYHCDLTKECTHLIVNPKCAKNSEKAKHAAMWGLKIVTVEWLNASIARKMRLSTRTFEYAFKQPSRKRSFDGEQRLKSSKSIIIPRAGNASSLVRRNSKLGNVCSSTNPLFAGVVKLVSTEEEEKKINFEDVPADADSQFLDGCRLFFTGFSEERLKLMRKMTRRGGGLRFEALNEAVTHCVVGSLTPKMDVKKFKSLPKSPVIVGAKWLVRCCVEWKCLPSEPFQLLLNEAGGFKDSMFVLACKENNGPSKNVEMGVTGQNSVGNTVSASENAEEVKVNFNFADLYAEPGTSQNVELTSSGDVVKKTNASSNLQMHMHENKRARFMTGCETRVSDTLMDLSPVDPKSLFRGHEFIISDDFSLDQKASMRRAIVGVKGSVSKNVKEADTSKILYYLQPFDCGQRNKDRRNEDFLSKLPGVTEVWLSKCVDGNRLFSVDDDFMYKPFLGSSIPEFSSYNISITGIESIYRQYIGLLIHTLGGSFKESLRKKDTTHLICYSASEKYHKAVQWNVKTVTVDWLYECARQGKDIPTDGFIFKPENVKRDTCDGIEEVPDFISRLKAKHPIPLQKVGNPLRQPKLNFTNCDSRPSFDTKDALLAVDTNMDDLMDIGNDGLGEKWEPSPHKVKNKENVDVPLDEYLTECVQSAIQSLRPSTSTPAKPLKKTTDTLLSNVRIVFSKKLGDSIAPLRKLLQAAKGCEVGPFDTSCTHFIHQSSKKACYTKEYKWAQNTAEIQVVSPHWLVGSIKENKILKELDYPPSFEPSEDDESFNVPGNELNEENVVEQNAPVLQGGEALPLCANEDSVESATSLAETVEKLINATKPTGNSKLTKHSIRRSRRIGSKKETSIPEKEESSKTRPMVRKEEFKQPAEAIAYDHSSGMRERERLVERLRNGYVKDGSASPTEKNAKADPVVTKTYKPQVSKKISKIVQSRGCKGMRFIFSGIAPKKKEGLMKVIKALGGVPLTTVQFDPTCTHLIVNGPSLTEKYLASLATGKWIIKSDYILACQAEGKFIDEEAFELSHETVNEEYRNDNPDDMLLGPREWRTRLNESSVRASKKKPEESNGAFKGWKVLLCVENKKKSGFETLLKAGRATVISSSPPFSADLIYKATHCFVDTCLVKPLGKFEFGHIMDSSVNLADKSKRDQESRGNKLTYSNFSELEYSDHILCLTPEYIADYLNRTVESSRGTEDYQLSFNLSCD